MTTARIRAERRGRRAERMAALWLRLKGYRILARRYRTPVGEIDLVVRRGRTLAFVEVKARADPGTALEAISARQRRRATHAARAYLSRHPPSPGLALRFDALILCPGRWPRHIANAWEAQDTGLP